MRKNSNFWFKLWFTFVGGLIILGIVGYLMQEYQDFKDGCVKTGEQRMVNSVVNAPDGAFSGVVVEDKFVCKTGRITWKAQYQ